MDLHKAYLKIAVFQCKHMLISCSWTYSFYSEYIDAGLFYGDTCWYSVPAHSPKG